MASRGALTRVQDRHHHDTGMRLQIDWLEVVAELRSCQSAFPSVPVLSRYTCGQVAEIGRMQVPLTQVRHSKRRPLVPAHS